MMEEAIENVPNYYAIIPSNIRYDESLTPNAKLLYGEITALCNKDGYCYATNEYFANLYNVSTRTITEWIKKLEDKLYLYTSIDTKRYNDGTVKKIRKIYINHVEVFMQNHIEVSRNNHIEENFSYNNTYNNNTYKEYDNNNKLLLSKKEEDFNKFWNMYPKKVDKKKAHDKYLKLDVPCETIIEGLKNYIEYINSNKKQNFIKNATTWLNGECWNDEYDIKDKEESIDDRLKKVYEYIKNS